MIRTNSLHMGGRDYTRYLARYAGKNRILMILGALFLCGVIIGTLLAGSAGSETMSALSRVVNGFIEKRREQTLFQNLCSASFTSLAFISAMFVCGFCAVSQPAVMFAPMFRGLGFGFSAASLYANYGARAAGFIALFILPNMLLSSIAILLCCRESLRLSGNFWDLMRGGKGGGYQIRIYLGRYAAASVLCIISAFFEAFAYFLFANHFILG